MMLVLPYPPSLNSLMRTIVVGKRAMPIKSKDYRDYESRVQALMLETRHGPFPAGVAVSVTLKLYRPARRGDLDNAFKATLDVLSGIAYVDDAQVVELHAFRYDDKLRPRAVVEITETDWPGAVA